MTAAQKKNDAAVVDFAAASSHAARTTTVSSNDGVARLLAVEDRLRSAESVLEFQHSLANDLRSLVGARQVVVLKRVRRNHWRATCVSNMPNVDRNSPFVRGLEQFVAGELEKSGRHDPVTTSLPKDTARSRDAFSSYPFHDVLWLPITLRSGPTFAGLLFLRDTPWTSDACELLQREAKVISDTWCAIAGRRRLKPTTYRRRLASLAGALCIAGTLAIPVPMTTLAPVEIVAQSPVLVTAPINGVIEAIDVRPNATVTKGDVLYRFVDTDLRNAFELAQREADVAISRHERLSQAAFLDETSRHEVSIAQTEMMLRIAERDYAREKLDKVVVRAERSGILIYGDKSSLLGRPVVVGERLMRIAQRDQVAADVSLPVADAIVLKRGADARLFLDLDPTRSRTAQIQTGSYHAEPDATGALVYTVRLLMEDKSDLPRIGARGTAQLFGDTVTLGFFLFRRPISWARQKFGF